MARNLSLRRNTMALPIIAAGIAARAIAKKLATRAVGGITGAGAKQVAPVYRNMQTGSVIKIPPVTKFQQQSVNTYKTQRVNDFKSGAAAQRAAKNTKNLDGLPKKPTIKIKSGK
jgi:hypothetical protein